MWWRSIRALALWCLFALAASGQAAQARADFPAGSTCHIFTGKTDSYKSAAMRLEDWSCQSSQWSDKQPTAWVRFDLAGRVEPRMLVTRISRFEALTIGVVGASGKARWRRYGLHDVHPLVSGFRFAIHLPHVPADARAVVLRIDRPGNAAILSEARITGKEAVPGWSEGTMLWIAAVCGLLVAPLAFNVAFWNVLRERFVIWHFTMAMGMLGYTLVSSGLVNRLIVLDVGNLAILNPLLFALPIAAGGFFSADFLEDKVLSGRLRGLLRLSGFWTLTTAIPLSIWQTELYPYGNTLYFLAYVPTLAIFMAAMTQAAWRRSRAVRFQLIGWSPLIVIGMERILRGMGLYGSAYELDQMIYLAIAVEIMMTALGVADRFMIIRHQRDRARIEALAMEGQAERDPLTGLYNRRAVEPRFGELHDHGYVTLAVIDLDHFKAINDTHGHAVGDKVLCATAAALAPDDDTLAMRLGGEEFMLLLRGPDAAARAERRRQAITARVAIDVPGLNRPVTASMGLVEYPVGGAIDADFARLYAHCDRLLYEAKHAGRNRSMTERMQGFAKPPRKRRVRA